MLYDHAVTLSIYSVRSPVTKSIYVHAFSAFLLSVGIASVQNFSNNTSPFSSANGFGSFTVSFGYPTGNARDGLGTLLYTAK